MRKEWTILDNNLYRNNKVFKGEKIVPIMKEILDKGGECKLVVTGNSMFPTLKNKESSVIITSLNKRKVKKGEIVFIQRDSGEYILHRVYKIIDNNKFIMNGDAQEWVEVVRFDQVIGVVKTILHNNNDDKDKEIYCDDSIYKLKILLWMKCRKFRRNIFKGYSLLKKIANLN